MSGKRGGNILETLVERDPTIDIAVIGAKGVGKTTLIELFVHGDFSRHHPTTGVRRVENNMSANGLKYHILDASGDKRFKPVVTEIVSSAKAFIICYDLTDRKSFESVKLTWLPLLTRLHDNNQYFDAVLVACKFDLEHSRTVTKPEGYKLANQMTNQLFTLVDYYEVSARDDDGSVGEVFSLMTTACESQRMREWLFSSIATGDAVTLQALVDTLGIEDINALGPDGRNLAHTAVLHKNIKALKILIKAGADVTIDDDTGGTLLDMAKSIGDKAMEKLIMGEYHKIIEASRKARRHTKKRLASKSATEVEAELRGLIPTCPGFRKKSLFSRYCKFCGCTKAQHEQYCEEVDAAAAKSKSFRKFARASCEELPENFVVHNSSRSTNVAPDMDALKKPSAGKAIFVESLSTPKGRSGSTSSLPRPRTGSASSSVRPRTGSGSSVSRPRNASGSSVISVGKTIFNEAISLS